MPSTRVLFVEDERSIAEPFTLTLAREGFEPEVVGTVAGALEAMARHPADIVLLDLRLPDGDGRDLCRELRRHSDVPIIMITARGTDADRIVGLELGADDYVVKPFSGAEVVARIRAVLRRSQRATPDAPPSQPVTIGELEVDFAARQATLRGQPLELSRKEFDL